MLKAKYIVFTPDCKWHPTQESRREIDRKLDRGEYTDLRPVTRIRTQSGLMDGIVMIDYTVDNGDYERHFFTSATKEQLWPEVEALKADWTRDPCWDIETTPGFEAFVEELRAYREEREARWDDEFKQRCIDATARAMERMQQAVAEGDYTTAQQEAAIVQAQALDRIASALEKIASERDRHALERINFVRQLYGIPTNGG